jgi:glycosyltransferase involved in cell wall biosynthesis
MVSTRFAGLDGVSLEAAKWAEVLETMGHNCFWMAGELDRAPQRSMLVPAAHFQSARNRWINSQVFGHDRRSPQTSAAVHKLRVSLKKDLDRFVHDFQIDVLIVENALAIPMHIPLGLALTEIIAERGLPAILHHHDFFWERARFAQNGVADFLRTAFPPDLPSIEHVVINTAAKEQLASRCGLNATLIPNVMDFENPPVLDRRHQRDLLDAMSIHSHDTVILQPTRVIQRKGIEHAVDLVKRLDLPHCKLVISHAAGDEGLDYARWLQRYAARNRVVLRLLNIQTAPLNGTSLRVARHYKDLWALYDRSDFVTFPSLTEGFGNALLEAVYLRKPLLVNRYDTFVRDIEPLHLALVTMDGSLGMRQVDAVRQLLNDPDRRAVMTQHNYDIACRHFSYRRVRNSLEAILAPYDRKSSARPRTARPLQQSGIAWRQAPRRPHSAVRTLKRTIGQRT